MKQNRMGKKKKQVTKWVYNAVYSKDTYLRIGLVHNKKDGVPLDIIRWQVMSLHDGEYEVHDKQMRVDEAIVTIAGLSKVLSYIHLGINDNGKFLKEYYKDFCKDEETEIE